jgi:L-amino acid N-acyltransferase YncA
MQSNLDEAEKTDLAAIHHQNHGSLTYFLNVLFKKTQTIILWENQNDKQISYDNLD